jgi:hypothetical protein
VDVVASTALAPIEIAMPEEMIRSALLRRVEVFNREKEAARAAVVTLSNVAKNLHQVFPRRGRFVTDFEVNLYFAGQPHHLRYRDDVDVELCKYYERQAWQAVIDEVQLWNVMGVDDTEKLQKQLERGDLPEFSVENVLSTIMGLSSQAKAFAERAAREVFDILTPHRSGLKTNSGFRVGRKAILTHTVEPSPHGGFKVFWRRDSSVRAVDAIFHVLDGKGPMKDGSGPLTEAINRGQATGETEYFKFKCFKNNNLHLEFKRLDLVKELNFVAAGERVLGTDS